MVLLTNSYVKLALYGKLNKEVFDQQPHLKSLESLNKLVLKAKSAGVLKNAKRMPVGSVHADLKSILKDYKTITEKNIQANFFRRLFFRSWFKQSQALLKYINDLGTDPVTALTTVAEHPISQVKKEVMQHVQKGNFYAAHNATIRLENHAIDHLEKIEIIREKLNRLSGNSKEELNNLDIDKEKKQIKIHLDGIMPSV